VKLFHRNKKKDASESDILISKDTKDFRYIVPKDYPDADYGDISRQSCAGFIKESLPDDRSPDYRVPLIDAYTAYNKAVINDHFIKNLHMWQVIKSGARAQKRRVESDLEFVGKIASILDLGGKADEESKR